MTRIKTKLVTNKTKNDAILQIAAKVFAEDGYEGADVQAIADLAHVGKGTIYRHFGDKKHFFLAVSDWVMRTLRDHIISSLSRGGSAIDKIVAGTRAYLGFFSKHPHYIEILIIERAVFRDTIKSTHIAYRQANISILEELVSRAVLERSLRKVDSVAVADALDNLCYGTVVMNALAHRKQDLLKQADVVLEMFMQGFCNR